ncbi:MAG: Phenylalanyl-tRNA synthetase beta chain, partial [Pseudomonadota bacterium]
IWLKHYLNNIGVGSISAIVDVTNYMCYAFGRPMHAYDKSKLSGDLYVARASNSQKFKALSGKEYELKEDDVIISDGTIAQALAGVIGGLESSCSETTSHIILESAVFDKDAVTKTGRRLGIETDSRYRFERHTDPMMVLPCLEFAADMISKICGGEVVSLRAIGIAPEKINHHGSIILDQKFIKDFIGYDISIEKSAEILQSLGFSVTLDGANLLATAPSWRHDISIKEDLIEEIVRIYGIDNIPSVSIASNTEFRLMKQSLSRLTLSKRVMAASGFNEVITWSFMNSSNASNFTNLKDELTLANPISIELDYMRPSIIPNLLEIVAKNHARSVFDLKIFEVGPIFLGAEPKDEKQVVSGLIAGNITANIHDHFRIVDVFDIKASLEKLINELGFDFNRFTLSTENLPNYFHPTRSAAVMLGKMNLGYFGEIHPSILTNYDIKKSVVAFELDLSALPESRLKYGKREEFASSVFQPVVRDFAFVMDEKEKVGPILTFVSAIDKKLIKSVELFDIYQGDKISSKEKSIAIKVTLQSDEKTLSEDELTVLQNDIINKVSVKFGCRLRD